MTKSTLPAPKPLAPLQNGVADPDAGAPGDGRATQQDYFPDFGASANVLVLLIIAGIAAVMLSLARDYSAQGFLADLGKTSMLVMWLAVSCAAVLALVRPRLVRMPVLWSTALALFLVLATTVLCSELIFRLGIYLGDQTLAGPAAMFPTERWLFISRNVAIATLIAVVVLRYFYVTHLWRINVQREAQSRFAALQARIRPHFLFNTMNTIAALTRTDPAAAEQAVEDLADLLRVSMNKPGESVTLEDEIELARLYQRMEEQRLGDRLRVDWQLDGVPLQTRVPGLTLQPLLENAIYHGIEPLAEGGTVQVLGETSEDNVTITVSNPVGGRGRRGSGHRLALDNIRQRLEFAYGARAQMDISEEPGAFRVRIGFPRAA